VPLLFNGALGDEYYEALPLHERKQGLEVFYMGFILKKLLKIFPLNSNKAYEYIFNISLLVSY
jgi:hypothetical protein